jgi:hypothetical protein
MNNMWAAVVEIGFLGWVGSAVGFIFRALDRDGKFIGRKALFWGGTLAVFYTLWIIGMLSA